MKGVFVQRRALNDIEAMRGEREKEWEREKRKQSVLGFLNPIAVGGTPRFCHVVCSYYFLLENNPIKGFCWLQSGQCRVLTPTLCSPITNFIWLIQLALIIMINIAKSSNLFCSAFFRCGFFFCFCFHFFCLMEQLLLLQTQARGNEETCLRTSVCVKSHCVSLFSCPF